MAALFEPTSINTLSMANRFVRSATWEGMAENDGSCTQRLTDLMARLARGGVGLIITGHTFVRPEGQAGPWQLAVYDDRFVAALSEMTRAVHDASGKIVMQLAHAGCNANSALTGQLPWGPSAVENEKGPVCREMTLEEIQGVVEAFARGAARAQKAGFDGVQIHAAHGYLLSQFLSPAFNRRGDEYGGSIEHRARLLLDVLRAIRSTVGSGFPVMVKMNAQDFVDNGLSAEEMVEVASMLEQAGIDAIEMSGGTPLSGKLNPVRRGKLESEAEEVYYREEARRFKARIGVPLMLVGGIRSYGVAERLVEEGLADYVSLCRPLIREPNLINRWKSGDRARSSCQSDNLCFKPASAGEGVYCVVERRKMEKA